MVNKPLVLALAFSESSLDYEVKHKIKGVIGICGVSKLYWQDLLKESNTKINSLKACEIIYNELLEKHNTKKAALKEYKGIISKNNNYLVDKVIKLEEQIIDNTK